MAQRPSVVVSEATSIPDPADIARVAAFAHEPFVVGGEAAEDVLAPGTVRRHAFEFARAELDAGATVPSQKWRRRWSLLLGLDRALHTEVPVLADGTTLNAHQVDALSGTYAALLADAQRRTSGRGQSDGDALLLSFEDDEPTQHDEPPAQVVVDEDEPEDDGPDDDGADDAPTGDTGEFAAVPAADDEEDEDDEERTSLEDELEELPDAEPENESALYDDDFEEEVDEDVDSSALDDPNAHKRFWFEHATGAGKTVAAMGFVEACRTGGVLILTHRRNLVDQFIAELQTRGYGERLSKPLLGDADIDSPGKDGNPAHPIGPVTIETYQWFVRNAGQISGAYTVVICDEAHTALGEKTSATIRAWTGPIFIGMTATGALIARHVTDLFPTQTSRFDLAQAARRGVIAPLRSLRIPPGPGVRTIAKVPLRKGEVDMEFDQDELAKLLDQAPFNLAIADLYKTRFRNTPGVVYTAGVQHAYNVAESFRALDMKAEAVSGETPKRELAKILADYEAGEIDVLVNAQLLAEGWNSPRATICMHLAPTASKRIYQQRVGRVTRRHPGKEAGVVIDFVHPATSNDDPVVTLHSLLDRDVYRGGAIVVGPVRRGRGRRVKVERRVLPVTPDIERRRLVFERELWRIAVEMLDWGEQRVWAALAGAKATPTNWRRGRAMLNFDRSGELRRQFLITALERNKNPQLRMRAIQEIAVLREADPFDTAIDQVGQWPRDERREASRVLLQAMADRRIGRREQATAWIWRLAEYTRDMHEEYAAQRWPATKHLLGLLVNSSGAAHARNARRLVHAARQHDRRLQAALLAAAVAHTPEAEEVLREARTRLARKPGALSRDLLKDFPSGKRRKKRSRNKKKNGGGEQPQNGGNGNGQVPDGEQRSDEDRQPVAVGAETEFEAATFEGGGQTGGQQGQGGGSRRSRSRRGRSRGGRRRGGGGGGGGQNGEQDGPLGEGSEDTGSVQGEGQDGAGEAPSSGDESAAPVRRRIRGQKAAAAAAADGLQAEDETPAAGAAASAADDGRPTSDDAPTGRSGRRRRRRSGGEDDTTAAPPRADAGPGPTGPSSDPGSSSSDARGSSSDVRSSSSDARGAGDGPSSAQGAEDGDGTARPSRRRRRAAAAARAEDPSAASPSDGASSTTKTAGDVSGDASAVERPSASAATAAGEVSGDGSAVERPSTSAVDPPSASGASSPADSTEADAPPKKRTPARSRATVATDAESAASSEVAPKRPATRRTAAAKAAEDAPVVATAAPDDVPVKKPRARRAAAKPDDAPTDTPSAAATTDAPAEKPAARRAAARTVDADAAVDAPAKPPTARRTAAAGTAKTTTAEKPTAAAKPRAAAKPKAAAKPRAAAKPKASAKPKAAAKPRAAAKPETAATTVAGTESAAAEAPAGKATAAKPKAAASKATASKAAASKAAASKATAGPRTAAAKTTAATSKAAAAAAGSATATKPKTAAKPRAAAKPKTTAAKATSAKKPATRTRATTTDDGAPKPATRRRAPAKTKDDETP